MKKMRKLISLIMALAFIFSMAVPAMAAEPTAQEVAGNRLLSLSVIDGYPGGGLGLDKTITRAEVAVVLAKISGMGSAADLLKDTPSKFSDVQANQWYTGWINLASAQGWVKGDPQGTFRPNDPVQYREMVTMLLKALGYNDNLPGDWPTNYLAKAASLSITKGIVSDAKAHAVRGDVFIMTSRTLDKDTVSYDKDNDKFVSSGKSLLEDKMEFAKVSGFVTDIPRVSSLKSNQIRIDGKVYKVVGDVDYEEIFGAEVNAWLNDDDEVVFVDVTSDAVYYDALEDVTDEELTLSDADADYDFAKNVKVFINGESAKASDLAASYDYAKVVLDEDGDVAFIDAYNWSDFLAVEKVDGDDILGYGDEIDAEDYTIVKDGKTIALADLAKGDILFYSSSAEYAEVFNKSVEGEISRIYTDRITVEGKDYKYADAKYIDENGDIANFTESNFEDVVEEMKDAGKVAVFVSRAGDMVFLSGDLSDLVTSSKYVFVTNVSSASYPIRNKNYYPLDVMNAEGTVLKYDVLVGDADDLVVKGDWANIAKNTVIEISYDKDGDIDEINLLDPSSIVDNDDFKVTSKYLKGNLINTDAVAFLIEDYTDDTDDIEVGTYSKLDFDYINVGTAFVKNHKVVAFVVSDSDREDDSTTYPTVATANQDKVSGKNIWRLKLVIDGKKATYDTKDGIANPGVVKGDLLEVKIDNKTGKVNAVTRINSGDRYVAEGLLSDIKTSDKSFKIAGSSFKLGTGAVIVDATDSYNVISLSNLKKDDYAKALRVSKNSIYTDVVVRTAKAGDAPSDPVASGVVTYITDATATDPTIIELDGKTTYVVNNKTSIKYDGATIALGKAAVDAMIKTGDATAEITEDDQISIDGDVITIVKSAKLDTAALSTAVTNAGTAKTAYTTAGGLTTDAVYKAVDTALAATPQVTADIKAATTALNAATKTLLTAKVADAKAALVADATFLNGNTALNNVTGDLTLPTADTGVTITWASDDSVTIDVTTTAGTGAVTQPSYTVGDKVVTLTATIVSTADATVKDTKVFTVTVKALAATAAEARFEAINTATTAAQMRTALEAAIGAELTDTGGAYTALVSAQKDMVAQTVLNARPASGFANIAAVQTAFDAAL